MKKKNIVLPFLFLLFFACLNQIKAQTPSFYNFNADNKLPFNKIYDMQFNSKSFLIFCSEKGVFKFDGTLVQEIPWEGKRTDEILSLVKDDQGRIWGKGLNNNLYKVEHNRVIKQLEWKKDKSSIFSFVADNNRIWLSSKGPNIHFYVLSEERFDSIPFPENTIDRKTIGAVIPKMTRNGNILLATRSTQNIQDGLIELNPNTNEVTTLLLQERLSISQGFMHKDTPYLIKNWSSVPNQVFSIGLDSVKEIEPINRQLGEFRTIRVNTSNDYIFFSGKTGLTVLNTSSNEEQFLLENIEVTSCHLVNDYSLWVSTLDKGLFYFPDFRSTTFNSSNSVIENDYISEIEKLDSIIYVADKIGNIYEVDQQNKVSIIFKQSKLTNTFLKTGAPHENTIYFSDGTFPIKISQNTSGTQLKPLRQSFANKDFSKWGNIILASGTEIATLETNKSTVNEFHHFLPKQFIAQNLFTEDFDGKIIVALSNSRSSLSLLNYKDSSIWINTRTGIFRFDKNSIDTIQSGETSSLITAMSQDSSGKVWISTTTNLLAYEGKNQVVLPEKLSELGIKGVNKIYFAANAIFFATNQGLYEWRNNILLKTTMLSGLPSNIVSDVVKHNQKLYVATKKGVTIFNDQRQITSNSPIIRLESMTVNGKKVETIKDTLLRYEENYLSFSLASLALNSIGEISYFYRCTPLEKEWIQISDASRINYPNLQPGTYRFEAYSTNYLTKQSNPIQIDFEIQRPIWMTLWFWLLLSLIVLIVVYFIITKRFARIKAKKDLKTKLIQAEIDGLKAQINPHFVFNALNSIQSLVIKKDVDKSNLFLGKFAQLLRRVLEYSSEKEITIEEEIQLLELYLDLEKLRFEEGLNVEISAEEGVDSFSIPPMMIQPHVENALKHGLFHSNKIDKKLAIEFKKDRNYVVCSISDNGIGRAASAKINAQREGYHQSFATEAIEKRVDLINETVSSQIIIKVIDLEQGTCIEILFPIDSF